VVVQTNVPNSSILVGAFYSKSLAKLCFNRPLVDIPRVSSTVIGNFFPDNTRVYLKIIHCRYFRGKYTARGWEKHGKLTFFFPCRRRSLPVYNGPETTTTTTTPRFSLSAVVLHTENNEVNSFGLSLSRSYTRIPSSCPATDRDPTVKKTTRTHDRIIIEIITLSVTYVRWDVYSIR